MRYAKFVFLAVFAACSLNAQEVTAGIYGNRAGRFVRRHS